MAPALLLVALVVVARWNPDGIEQNYARSFYPTLSKGLAAVFGSLPFSASEVLLALFIAFALFRFWRGFRRCRNLGLGTLTIFTKALLVAVRIALPVILLFLTLWGLNAWRPPVAQRWADGKMVLPFDPSTLLHSSASAACLKRKVLGATDKDAIRAEHSLDTVRAELARVIWEMEKREVSPPPVKRPLASLVFESFNIRGVYSPFTGEPNVIATLLPVELPFTAAHEMAHACGVVSEAECNWFAYQTCTRSGDVFAAYAAHVWLLRQLRPLGTDAQAEAARGAWNSLLTPEVLADIEAIDTRIRENYGVIASTQRAINSGYLHLMGYDGVEDYTRAVQLLREYTVPIRIPSSN